MAKALETMMPPMKRAAINGLDMAYWETGPAGEGPPVIFCHGFPELAFSWRAQLEACGKAGRWAAAPDQRGYGETKGPSAVDDVTMDGLIADLLALLDHLGAEKAVWVGHDWGGLVVWPLATLHPERTAGVIGVNTPFLPRSPMDPIALFRARYGDDMYIVRFQERGTSEALFEADVEKTMRFFMRKPREGAPAADSFSGDPKTQRALALQIALAGYDPARDEAQFLTPDELSVFVEGFERSGFEGPINWYRNFTRNWERAEGGPQHVGAPSLMIMAEKDVVLAPALADGMERFVPDLEKHLVLGSGHWTQQEKPDEVNRVILDWLDRRFPTS